MTATAQLRRGPRPRPWHHLYGRRWRAARAAYLAEHPDCVYCDAAGRDKGADTVDHITPHEGDLELFWDRDNWQSLCRRCHDGRKRHEERSGRGGHSDAVDADGYPVDPAHPANRDPTICW